MTVYCQRAEASAKGKSLCIRGIPANRGRERIGTATGARPAPEPGPAGGPPPGIAAEIREFAVILGKLGALRDSGLLTDEEFSEKKQRLLGR